MFSYDDMFQMLFSTVLAGICCLAWSVVAYARHRDLFSPSVILPATYFLFYYSASLCVCFVDESAILHPYLQATNLPLVVWLNTLGLVGLCLGLATGHQSTILGKVLPNAEVTWDSVTPFLLFLVPTYFMTLAADLLSSDLFFDIYEGGSALYRIRVIAGISTVVLVYILELSFLTKNWTLYWAVLASYMVVSLMLLQGAGMRGRLIYIVLVWFMVISYSRRQHGNGTRAAMASRHWQNLAFVATVLVLWSFSAYVKFTFNRESEAGEFSFARLLAIQDYNDVLSNEIDFYEGRQGEYGLTFVGSLFHVFMPYSLTGIRLMEPIQVQYHTQMEQHFGYTIRMGLDYGLNAEGYVNFGWLGVALVMFVIGFATASYYRKYVQNRRPGVGVFALASPYIVIAAAPDIFRREFTNFVHVSVTFLLVVWVPYYFLKKTPRFAGPTAVGSLPNNTRGVSP